MGADHATVPYLRSEDQNPAQATHIQVRRLWLYSTQRRQSSSDNGLAGTIQIFGQNTLGTRGIQACGERIGIIRGQSAYVLHAFGEAGNRDGLSLTVVHHWDDIEAEAAKAGVGAEDLLFDDLVRRNRLDRFGPEVLELISDGLYGEEEVDQAFWMGGILNAIEKARRDA